MLKLLIYGVLVHILFLASIFVIYFQSPVIQGLRPQENLSNAPAKRLVLIVADGFRAESFYRDGCRRTPFVRDIILRHGMQGISHTRIPTESRPGHVALIGGLYEDPSAVLRGWQENPVDFDSIFNRSSATFAWGSPDVLSVFNPQQQYAHVHLDAYNPSDEDFSGASATARLDEWVFERFAKFLRSNETRAAELKSADGVVFFLHLLGLDTAGHVHKPNSQLFDRNVDVVDAGVRDIVRLVEQTFADERTAFMFTADHGMTDAGAHGAGDRHETETPFVAWGAGVAHWRRLPGAELEGMRTHSLLGDGIAVEVPRFDIEQADAAPLMAALLGLAVPMNNFGALPVQYLNVSKRYSALAMHGNALQMGAQFERLQSDHGRGMLSGWLGDYAALNAEMAVATERRIRTALVNSKYALATELSTTYLHNCLLGIEYYQQYYQRALLVAVCLAMAGWIVYIVQKSTIAATSITATTLWPNKVFTGIVVFLVVAVGAFAFVQRIPLQVAIFFVLPIVCWLPCNAPHAVRLLFDIRTWLFVFAADVLVWTFFYRAVLGGLMLVLPVVYVLTTYNGTRRGLLTRNVVWLVTCAMLGAFTLLPVVGKSSHMDNTLILQLSIVAWLLKLTGSTWLSAGKPSKRTTIDIVNWLLFCCAAGIVIYVADGFEKQRGLNIVVQTAAWSISGVVLMLILWQPRGDASRLSRIANAFSVPFVLMSLSYEPLFLLVLAVNLNAWLRMERSERSTSAATSAMRMGRDAPRAYLVLVYVLLSFFGTGNLASISSFDPNAVRCFVGTFSPFVMAALIVVKLFVPVLLMMCATSAITVNTRRQQRIAAESSLFIVVLLISDIMCAHFLFFVRNKGSWLDIGVSISHFVIMESTVLVLCVLEWLSRRLLDVRFGDNGSDDLEDGDRNEDGGAAAAAAFLKAQ